MLKNQSQNLHQNIDHCDLCAGEYVAYFSQSNWFFGTANNISVPNGGAEVNFMHTKKPSISLSGLKERIYVGFQLNTSWLS